MDKDYIVKKSNYFVMNSSYDLSMEEQKIILTLASMVKPEDEEFKRYKFNISEFIALIGIKNQSQYTEIPTITKGLMKKVFEIQEEDMLIQVAWLSSVVYKKGSGYVELEFSPRLKPYMLKLNSMFTQYKLGNILMMKSKYSPRIYEFLKCNEFKKQKMIEFSLNQLRKLLKVENAYLLYADFKRFVLFPAQKEIDTLTDISFTFEEIKKGRKVDKIKFYITSNKNMELEDVPEGKKEQKEQSTGEEIDIDDLIDQLREIIHEKLKTKEYKAILEAANNDIELIQSKYQIAKKQRKIDNLVGWMMKAIQEEYSEPVEKRKATSFDNFKGREYDYEELERKLLEH